MVVAGWIGDGPLLGTMRYWRRLDGNWKREEIGVPLAYKVSTCMHEIRQAIPPSPSR